MCTTMAAMCLLAAYVAWKRWGPLPDIRATGRIVDRDTGIGVADANVIIAITASEAMWHGSHRGCTNGSAVVRTDGAGNFEYSVPARDAFGPRNPSGWSITLFAYHPNYEAALRRDLPPQSLTWIAEMSEDGPPLSVPYGYRTYPMYASQSPGPFVMEVTRRREPELDQLSYFGLDLSEKCLDSTVDRGQSEFLQKIYQRAWAIRCDRPLAREFPTFHEFKTLHSFFESVLWALSDQVTATDAADVRAERNSDRGEYLFRHLLAWYPSYPAAAGFGRGPSQEELEKLCEMYQPPVKSVLTKDYRSWIDASRF